MDIDLYIAVDIVNEIDSDIPIGNGLDFIIACSNCLAA